MDAKKKSLVRVRVKIKKNTQILFLLIGLFFGIQAKSQNLNMRHYNTGSFIHVDYAAYDAVFGTVTSNGTVRTSSGGDFIDLTLLPTTATGFTGVDLVSITGSVPTNIITMAQADALVDYVKGGGILFANCEENTISGTGMNLGQYIGSRLLCNNVAISYISSPPLATDPPSVPSYHPGSGNMLATPIVSVGTSSSFGKYTNVPSLNALILGETSVATPCDEVKVLDFIVPGFPSGGSPNNTCGVNGFAIFSGEVQGIMSLGNRSNSPLNKAYAQLAYDFLYDASAMATRLDWTISSGGANANTTCHPTGVFARIENFMRHGKHFQNGEQKHMYFGNAR